MSARKRPAVVATVIGDVVGSRAARDRARLHARLEELLAGVNDALAPAVPLRITVGDEFQGSFTTVGEALRAVQLLQVRGLPEIDLRHGIGWGEVSVLGESPRVEDGPGWWAARAAIEAVKQDATRAALRHVRTAYRRAEATEGPDEEAVDAALLLRDQLVGSLSERSLGVLRGLMSGTPQRVIADQVGITASAVSQRVRKDGLAVLLAAGERLGEVR